MIKPGAVIFSILVLVTLINTAHAGQVVWKTIGPNDLEAANAQHWDVRNLPPGAKPRSFEFFALRFHLGYYQMRLVNIADFAQSKSAQIAQEQKAPLDAPALLDLGVGSVFRTNPFLAPMVAVAPAGFPASNRVPTNLGLLKINGNELSKLLPKGPSAILCLNNAPSALYQYQVPTFYRTNNPNQLDQVNQCRDEVQVGPRIIEDPNSTERADFEADSEKYKIETYSQKIKGNAIPVSVYLGISQKNAFSTPYLRAVLAVDDPGRVGKPDSNNTERELARDAYIIVTTSPATLWDLQDMLASSDFYAKEQYAPHWAVNLPGDNYASMIHVGAMTDAHEDKPTEVGATDERQASVLVVTQRR